MKISCLRFRFLALCAFAVFICLPAVADAALVITDIKVKKTTDVSYSSNVIVPAGTTIHFSVTAEGSATPSPFWKSTAWTIGAFSGCVDTPNLSSSPVTASGQLLVVPVGLTSGTYALLLVPNTGSISCDGVAGTGLSLAGAITIPASAVCGNGILESGEACDDGNISNGDCCSSACQFEESGSLCGSAGAGVCDLQDTCNATGVCQPNYASVATECRTDTGACDVAELCDGAGSCPADAFEPDTTECGNAGDGFCDVQDTCIGNANTCVDNVAEADVVCRADGGACDVAELCDGTTSVCPADAFEPDTTECGDGSTTDCTEPDTCNGLGECLLFHNIECGSVTNSELCEFDEEPGKPGDQFRLSFSPDMQNWVSYKQNSSNPGQFYYNAMYDATGATEGVTLYIAVPYPFVTQGAMPLHVYDGDSVPSNGSGCLAPEDALSAAPSVITMADWINGTNGCDVVDDGADVDSDDGVCVIEVSVNQDTIDGNSGDGNLLYVNLHLDYGLKGPMVDANDDGFDDRYDRAGYISPWGSSDALFNTGTNDGPVAIADCSEHVFFHADGETIPDDIQFSDSVENMNVFKKPAGAFGHTECAADSDPLEGFIQMRRVDNNLAVYTTQIDADGYYAAAYAHKGKPTYYYLAWCADVACANPRGTTAGFGLQSNGFVQVDLLDLDGTAPYCNGTETALAPITPVYSSGKFK